ncbi:stilbene synthase [Streptomonospora alba]|uniref:Stilbene synthase n=1 Tax=Streptomonospora alba TaxID=183763 RepID=A0A0C2JRT7_9ACTN|nr:3-oxoacyl-[acyl-carrier-protein] synthase III C-terminal domain-containing protein [Streptomonospora alba]KIH99537.1 stilbene synthase [Streptomonospora alba]
MRIAAVRTVLPEHYYSQEEITDAFARWTEADERLLRRFHAATQVTGRPLVWPLEEYRKLNDFTTANDAFIDNALDLGERAIQAALSRAQVAPSEVDQVIVCSSTGIATPSLDARLAQRVGFRADVKRVPVFGLGCSAGAAGLARLHDYLHGWPDQVALLVCVELCSLTLQRDDTSKANLVASGLFGDGAAAVVALGEQRAERSDAAGHGPRVVASRSKLYPDTDRLMGWDIGEHGFRTILAADLADHVESVLAEDVASFLDDHGLAPEEVASWVCHPGGPKVIDKLSSVLALGPGDLDLTWRSLRRLGNLSSVSVLDVLEETIAERRPSEGEPGLLMALGPGFSADLVLLRW